MGKAPLLNYSKMVAADQECDEEILGGTQREEAHCIFVHNEGSASFSTHSR